MKKKATVLLFVSCTIATGIIVLNKNRHEIGAILKSSTADRFQTIQSTADISRKNSTIASPDALSPINPWDYHAPLSVEEKREFELVEAQIHKFLTWGKMDPNSVTTFRQILFKIGDRAIADIARELSNVTKEEIRDKNDAEGIVHKIDALAYFANSQNPLGADSVASLAKRPITWNDAGELINPVEANITFEMFDIFARVRPDEALQFIKNIDKKQRTAYFTHYAYGRKLAGKTMEEIDLELREVFGSPDLALK